MQKLYVQSLLLYYTPTFFYFLIERTPVREVWTTIFLFLFSMKKKKFVASFVRRSVAFSPWKAAPW